MRSGGVAEDGVSNGMKFLVRWAFRLFLLGLVLVVALLLLKDTILKSIAESRLRAATGMEVRIGKLEVALDRPVIRIENLVIYNPAEFGGSPLLDLGFLLLEYDLDAIRDGHFHARLLRLELKELHIVESQNGRTNVFVMMETAQRNAASNKSDAAKVENQPAFDGIDTLNLSLGTFRFTSLKDARRNQLFDLNLHNEVFQKVRSEQDVAAILLRIVLRQGVSFLMGPRATIPSPTSLQPVQPAQSR